MNDSTNGATPSTNSNLRDAERELEALFERQQAATRAQQSRQRVEAKETLVRLANQLLTNAAASAATPTENAERPEVLVGKALLRFYQQRGSNLRDFRENLIGVQVPGARLSDADFRDRDLANANFAGASLSYANFTGANLRGANFIGARLENANFNRARIYGANFTGAYMEGADFTNLRESGAAFTGADLKRARFAGVDLDGNNFVRANLLEANFAGCTISTGDHKLIGTILLNSAHSAAEYDHATGRPDVLRVMLAHLVINTPGMCWRDFLKAGWTLGIPVERRRELLLWAARAMAPFRDLRVELNSMARDVASYGVASDMPIPIYEGETPRLGTRDDDSSDDEDDEDERDADEEDEDEVEDVDAHDIRDRNMDFHLVSVNAEVPHNYEPSEEERTRYEALGWDWCRSCRAYHPRRDEAVTPARADLPEYVRSNLPD